MRKVIYKKVFTRDFSLPMLEVWYRGEAFNPKQWTNKKQPFLPYIVFERNDGTVTAYYNPRGVKWIKNLVMEIVEKDKTFLKRLAKTVRKKLKPIQPIYDNEKVLSKSKLLKFIDEFENAYPWIEAMWWLCEMNKKKLEGIDISSIQKVRKLTSKLSTGTDIVVRKSLSRIFPELKDYVHVLTIKEIKSEKFPDINEIKKRDKGFFYTQNTLHVGITRKDIEQRYGIILEKTKITPGLTEIKGNTAYPGTIKGKVRRIMGHKHIFQIKKGEILVSPMTMPDFLPAMKKASAFITDEGGITCHASIVARELKKPCIIGTKIATKVLKDGDLVEVDANRGLIRLLERRTSRSVPKKQK